MLVLMAVMMGSSCPTVNSVAPGYGSEARQPDHKPGGVRTAEAIHANNERAGSCVRS